MSPITRLYVRLPNWLGDVCMSLPSLALLRDAGVPLVLCARGWAQDLLAGVSMDGFVTMCGSVRRDRAAVRAHLRQNPYPPDRPARVHGSYGLLLPNSLSSAAVFALADVPSAGYRGDGRGLLLSWPIAKPRDADLHAVHYWYDLTRQALTRWGLPTGAAAPAATLDLPLTDAHQARARAACAEHGLLDGSGAGRFILIAPTATGQHRGQVKVWPGFDALTRALQAAGHIVVMCPPPAEVAQARRNAPTATLLPALSLGAFAALTRLAALVVCNDSGVSHVAAAAGARQLTLFGVTRPEHTGPWSPDATCLGTEGQWPEVDAVLAQTRALLAQGDTPVTSSTLAAPATPTA